MNDLAKQRSAQKRRRDKAVLTMMSGNLPDRLKITAFHIAFSARASCQYEWAWIAESELSRRVGVSERTIRKYVKLLGELQIFRAERMGPTQWAAALVARYGYRLPKTTSPHRFVGYTIRWDHPVWQSGRLPTEDLARIQESLRPTIRKPMETGTYTSGFGG